MQVMNKNTAKEYYFRLVNFEKFVISQYNINHIILDTLIIDINNGKIDPYELLSNYCIYLQEVNGIKTNTTLKQRVVTVKNFLEFNDIDISPRKFKLKVKLPRNIRRLEKEALDRNDIVNILNSCSEIRLKTYIMLLASTGMRAVEALSIRLSDLDLNLTTAIKKVTIRGEYTKTKVDRYVFLTKEMVGQLTKWLEFKYRTRRICYTDKSTGRSIKEYRTPQKNVNDFVFSVRNNNNESIDGPKHFYTNLVTHFEKTLDRNGIGGFFNKKSKRREITLHSFRRYVKSTISDLGYADYSEWFIGHAGSEYWKRKDNDKAEIFKKIEPYLTFLDIQQLERQGADLQTQIEELQDVNQVLRNKDYKREERMKGLEDQIEQIQTMMNTLVDNQNKERQLNREFELESDPLKKDEKFDKMFSATRETIRK